MVTTVLQTFWNKTVMKQSPLECLEKCYPLNLDRLSYLFRSFIR